MNDHKTTRDIAIEIQGMLSAYIPASNERREICGKRFEGLDEIIETQRKELDWLKTRVIILIVLSVTGGGSVGYALSKLNVL